MTCSSPTPDTEPVLFGNEPDTTVTCRSPIPDIDPLLVGNDPDV